MSRKGKKSTRATRATAREERAARRADKQTKRRNSDQGETVKGFLLKIGIILGVFCLFYIVMVNSGIKVEKFDIVGNRIVTDQDVISLSGISEGNELFRTDTAAAENQILLHVMIDDVNVRVRPNNTILIEVTEKDAVAGFMVDDTYFYLDEKKVVCGESDTVDEVLPLFSGFKLPSFVSIGLPLEDPVLDNDLEIAKAAKNLFEGYKMEIAAQSKSVNNLFLNGIEVRLGSLNRLEYKMQVLNNLIHSMSVQKLESLDYIDVSVPDEPVTMELPIGGEVSEEEKDGSEVESIAEQPAKKDNKRDTTEAE